MYFNRRDPACAEERFVAGVAILLIYRVASEIA